MSRIIRNDHLWTEDEVRYKLARCLDHEVRLNRKLFGPGGAREGQQPEPEENDDDAPVTLDLDRDVYEHVVALDLTQVKEELKGLGVRFASKASEQELKMKLAQALQAKKDDDSNQ